jgi:hypothetical protein
MEKAALGGRRPSRREEVGLGGLEGVAQGGGRDGNRELLNLHVKRMTGELGPDQAAPWCFEVWLTPPIVEERAGLAGPLSREATTSAET